jgi:outer membrane protein assembly factor BamB
MRAYLLPLALCGCSAAPAAPIPIVARASGPAAPSLGTLQLLARVPWTDRGVQFAGGGHPLALTAVLPGDVAASPSLEVTVSASSWNGRPLASLAMSRALFAFVADLPTSNLPDGPLRLVATARDRAGDSWTSATLAITIDNTPPSLSLRAPALEVVPAPRDFSADATVVADDGAGAGVVSFELEGLGVPRSSTAVWPLISQGDHAGPGVEGRAHVTGSDLRLDGGPDGGLDGTFELVASATDGVGNVGTVRMDVPVTRLRWRVTGSPFTTAPILDRRGQVIQGDATGRLWAVGPDGSAAWSTSLSALPLKSTPAIWESPAGEILFAPTLEGGLFALNAVDGALVRRFAAAGGPVEAAPAIDSGAGAVAVASTDGTLRLLDARTGVQRSSLPPPPRSHAAPTAVSLAGDLGVVVRADGAGFLFDASAVAPAEAELGAFELPGGLAAGANAPAWSSGSVWLAGLGGLFSLADPVDGVAWLGPSGVAAGPLDMGPVVDGAGNVFAAGERALVALRPDGSLAWSLRLVAPAAAAPTIGADGLLYASTTDGRLSVVSPAGAVLWSAPLAAPGARPSSAMIDPCRRTLYVAVQDGTGGSLWALAVDSPGLDVRPAAWPHFRHDYQGTGNARTVGTVACGP